MCFADGELVLAVQHVHGQRVKERKIEKYIYIYTAYTAYIEPDIEPKILQYVCVCAYTCAYDK